jgi:hypothetical protein
VADPVPLRRVVLPAGRLPDALRGADAGALLSMPRQEFEALVRRAARQKGGKNVPRLVRALYRARLLTDAPAATPSGLGEGLAGTAEWKVSHPGAGPALLRLQGEGEPFNLAVKNPRFGNRDALIAEFPEGKGGAAGRGLALLVDRPGEHTVTLEWSARAESRPEGLQIDLHLPGCPAAVLEVELPADRALAALDGALVSGPLASGSQGRKLWRVACDDRTHLPLLVRRGGRAAPVILARARTVQKLTPDGLESLTSFSLEVLHHELTEIVCECDPVLRPTDVVAPGLKEWKVEGSRVRVRLERPLRQGVVELRCLAPLGEAGTTGLVAWRSPAVRVQDALARGETLELLVHPELQLAAWRPGDFRLAESSPFVDPETKVRLRRLVLQGGGLASAGQGRPVRPGADLQTSAVAVRARQQAWWVLGGDSMSLTVHIEYRVRQGLLFQLPVRLPPGWEVQAVSLDPAALLRNWGERDGKGGRRLLVDLHRPVRGGAGPVTLAVRLRPTRPEPLAGRDLVIPDVAAEGALFREGGLAIDYDELVYLASVRTTAAAGEPGGDGPWGKLAPDFYYPYRGQAVTGTLRLRPRTPRFRARARADVYLAAGRAGVQARLVLEGEGGATRHVDVHLSTAGPAWDWQVEPSPGSAGNRVRRVERLVPAEAGAALAGLAARSPLGAAVLQAGRPGGSFWRLTLERPLPLRQPLTLRATRTLAAAGPARWEVPLPLVLGASRQEAEAAVHLAGGEPAGVDGRGLRQAGRDAAGPHASAAWRTFRYDDPSARLRLATRAPRAEGASGAVVDRVRLSSLLTGGGEVRRCFRFRLRRWSQRALPVRLPAGARLLAASVNGRWLDQLAGDPSPDPSGLAEGALELPVPAAGRGGDGSAHFEILYTTPAPPAGLWQRLGDDAPVLPVSPDGAVARRWLLPPGVLPVYDGAARRLPGREDLPAPLLLARKPEDLFRLGPALPLPTREGEVLLGRRQALADAAAGLRSDHAGKTLRLDALVEEVAFVYLPEAQPLVLDADALARAGVGPGTKVRVAAAGAEAPVLPWEALGLRAAPARAGVLLGAAADARRWDGALPESIESAVAAAAANGRDPSGRFLTALEWLHHAPAAPRPDLPAVDARDGWAAWEPAAGGPGTLVVVRRGAAAGGGLALAAVLGLLLLGLRRAGPRVRLRFLLLWLAAAGVSLAWLPAALRDLAWWPLLAGLAVALPWYLAWACAPRRAAPRAAAAGKAAAAVGAGAAGLLALLLSHLPGPARAAPPAAEVVYLLAGGGRPSVLAPARLVARLKDMARPAAAPAAGAVLVSAAYEGKVVGGAAEFTAELRAHVLGDAPAVLALPFEGVRLTGDVLVDDARVYPEAAEPPQAGFTLRLRGAGRHTVKMQFRAASLAAGPKTGPARGGQAAPGIRQVRFGVPRLVQSTLAFRVGPGASHLQALVKHGAQRVTADKDGQRLEVELGAIAAPVQLRWYQEGRPGRAPRVTFREAYLWDLRPDASFLSAVVRYTISGGAVPELLVGLPDSLEVRSAQARRLASGRGKSLPQGAPAPPEPPVQAAAEAVRLADWFVSGSGASRVVRLEFPGPVSGELEVTLDLVPRQPWGGLAELPVPRPHGQAEPGKASYLGYRASGLHAQIHDYLRLGHPKPAEFAAFWPPARPAAAPQYAWAFVHDPRTSPRLVLRLAPLAAQVEASQAVTVRVGRRQAEVTNRAVLRAANKDLSLFEWEVGGRLPFVAAAVRGPDVRGWCQSGNRLLVWLEKTTGATQVEVTGWLPLGPVAPGGKAPGPPVLEAPCFKLRGAKTQTQLALSAEPGLALAVRGRLRGLAPQGRPAPGELRYAAAQPDYAGRFVVLQGRAPKVTVVTRAGLKDREIVFTSTIDYSLQGELRTVGLRLREWEGSVMVAVESPGRVVRRREQVRRASGRSERTWSLGLEGVRDHCRLVVGGRVSLEEAGEGAAMPDVTVLGVPGGHTLVVDASLAAEGAAGLSPADLPAGSPAGALAWRVSGDEWRLRLTPRRVPQQAPVRVVLAEHRLRPSGGQPWRHEAVFWVRHEAAAELRLHWAGAVRVAGASVGGAAAAVLQPEPDRLWLPLPGPAGTHEVRVRWDNVRAEPLRQPDMTLPALEGAEPGTVVWTVDVPPGWEAGGGGRPLGAGADRRAVLELYRASVQLAVVGDLVRQGQVDGPALAAAQRRFTRGCWLARLALQAGANPLRPGGPRGEPLGEWLARMRQQNKELTGEGPAAEACRRADALAHLPEPGEDAGADLPAAGTPTSWLAGPAGAPAVRLSAASARQVRQALSFSGQWLVVLLAAWAVTLSGVLRSVVRWLWPEQLLLLGVVGWQAAGPTAVVVLLLALGVAGRLLLAGRAVRSLLPAAPARQAAAAARG